MTYRSMRNKFQACGQPGTSRGLGVAKGSLINKVILVPLALIISAFIPWAITPLLMIGGAFLCFEGVEKVLHMLEARKHKEDPAQSQQRLEKLAAQDPLKFERTK